MKNILKKCIKNNIPHEVKRLVTGYEAVEMHQRHAFLFFKDHNKYKIESRGFHSDYVWVYDVENHKEIQKIYQDVKFLNDMFYKSDYITDAKKAKNTVLEWAQNNDMMQAYDIIYN